MEEHLKTLLDVSMKTSALIKKIENTTDGFDFLKYKEKFFSIEADIKSLPDFEKNLADSVKRKVDDVKRKHQYKEAGILIVYLEMINALSESRNDNFTIGVIVGVIPVICELIRGLVDENNRSFKNASNRN
jgi:hypothetical protein